MIITLSIPEQEMLETMKVDDETVESVCHRILAPLVAKHAETRLQTLADMYRQLSAEHQIEAINLLKVWQMSKRPVESNEPV